MGNPRLWTRPINEGAYCAKPTSDKILVEDQRALSDRSSQFEDCYADLSLRVSKAAGKVEAEVTLAADGTVTEACITHATTLDDHEMAQCVLEELRTMKFNPPGKQATALMPLQFGLQREPVPYRQAPPSTRDHYCISNPELGAPCNADPVP